MATYTKLNDGTWGLRSTESITAGVTVTVTKKSGETKVETVGKVIWSGNGVTLATIASSGHSHSHAAHSHARHSRNGCECNCGDCSGHCHCDPHCNCRGGNIYDC